MRSSKRSKTRMDSREKRISVSVGTCARMPPAASLVVPLPIVSRSNTTTSRTPRRASRQAMLQPTTPPPMMTTLAVRAMSVEGDGTTAGPRVPADA